MTPGISALQRFFYSHYFFGGLRQAAGVILPALLLGGLLQDYRMGMVAAIGAACVAVVDQPGGPREFRKSTLFGAVLLGTLTVAITGLTSTQTGLFWLTVPALCFMFSMLTVYGRQGGLMAFACLLIMTLTMREPLQSQALLIHTLYSLAGGLFYFSYSIVVHRLAWFREEQQALSVALFATSDYVRVRSRFYDVAIDLDTTYRDLVRTQSDMTEKQQAVRNIVLRDQPVKRGRADRRHTALLNIFIDMVALLDSLIATHTDYATLRRSMPDSDMLVFARDALVKLSNNLADLALQVARNQPSGTRHSAKAELRAFEYELEQFRQSGQAETQPELYALLVQVLRRLRNGAHIIERMVAHTRDTNPQLVDQRLEQALDRFVSRSTLRFGMITSNLRLDSPHFRYALRVALAALLAMSVSAALSYGLEQQGLGNTIHLHGYWIVLTIVVIMKPGFALTRQRNGFRLVGTVIGSLLALGLFHLTDNPDIHFAVLVVACVLGYSLIQVNFMGAAVFNTLMVLLVFHFVTPESMLLVGERLIDTFIGCCIALLCSYVLPWWESSFMASLAKALRTANHRYFKAGLRYAGVARELSAATSQGLETAQALQAEYAEADVAWRVARKNVHIAFGNYAAAFYRMISEPPRQQKNVPELNHLLIQNHVLSMQIAAAVPLLAGLETVPPGIAQSLNAIDLLLDGQEAVAPTSIETEGELAALAYPVRQMVKAAAQIHQEMKALEQPVPARRLGRVKPHAA